MIQFEKRLQFIESRAFRDPVLLAIPLDESILLQNGEMEVAHQYEWIQFPRGTLPEQTDELLPILANHHCRTILSYFQDSADDVALVQDLTDEISKQAHGGIEQNILKLQHSALPRLTDAGVIDYDRRSETVQYRGSPELEQLVGSVADLYPLADTPSGIAFDKYRVLIALRAVFHIV
ncbi:DUF7344 domain-containing protein [Halorussus aquaticus]|uniref:DUF7344 domain-containing protein n=1 Tax=Halorussus aquaticus TaxID=2953748 RepID=UPI0020B642EE|nr:hypothetical protein [Halorussus aquaticus]